MLSNPSLYFYFILSFSLVSVKRQCDENVEFAGSVDVLVCF
jgi:hypothetical protein